MVKIKKPIEDCKYVIHPLGKGLPLCLYKAVKEKRLGDVKIRDLPMCKYQGVCPKENK